MAPAAKPPPVLHLPLMFTTLVTFRRPQALESHLTSHPGSSDLTHINMLAELYMGRGHYQQVGEGGLYHQYQSF